MNIPAHHPFRILLVTSQTHSINFTQCIKNANSNTRVAVADNPNRLEKLLCLQGMRLPHLIFLDLVDPIENVFESFGRISTCSILQSIPIVVFTSLVIPEMAAESFSGSQVLFVRKRQTSEALTESIQKILNLEWRKYLTEKIPAAVPAEKEVAAYLPPAPLLIPN